MIIKNPPIAKFLKDRGMGEGKLLSRSFLPPYKTTIIIKPQ